MDPVHISERNIKLQIYGYRKACKGIETCLVRTLISMDYRKSYHNLIIFVCYELFFKRDFQT